MGWGWGIDLYSRKYGNHLFVCILFLSCRNNWEEELLSKLVSGLMIILTWCFNHGVCCVCVLLILFPWQNWIPKIFLFFLWTLSKKKKGPNIQSWKSFLILKLNNVLCVNVISLFNDKESLLIILSFHITLIIPWFLYFVLKQNDWLYFQINHVCFFCVSFLFSFYGALTIEPYFNSTL